MPWPLSSPFLVSYRLPFGALAEPLGSSISTEFSTLLHSLYLPFPQASQNYLGFVMEHFHHLSQSSGSSPDGADAPLRSPALAPNLVPSPVPHVSMPLVSSPIVSYITGLL